MEVEDGERIGSGRGDEGESGGGGGGEASPGVSVRRNGTMAVARSLLVFHRFQSIKLVAVVLPSADHAIAVPFLCFATTSAVFLIPFDFLLHFSARRGFVLLAGSLDNPAVCRAFFSPSAGAVGKKFPPGVFTVP